MLTVHDYFTQRGGAERVAMEIAARLSGGHVLTAFYEPATTFPQLADMRVDTLPLNSISFLRQDPRRAFPLLAAAFSRVVLDEPTVICSSSGWAHGVSVSGHKIVYCHNPARWLYQTNQYLADQSMAVKLALRSCRPSLVRWDRRAAQNPRTTYLANSRSVADRIQGAYGITAPVLPPPVTIDPAGEQLAWLGLEPGFLLTVGRSRGYKRLDAVLEAVARLPGQRLVVVGAEPEAVQSRTEGMVTYLPRVSDAQLRWIYAHARALVALGEEDFGLTPLEANTFGTPVVALRAGGYLDTIIEGLNGFFVDDRSSAEVARGVRRCLTEPWDQRAIRERAASFGIQSFCARLTDICQSVTS